MGFEIVTQKEKGFGECERLSEVALMRLIGQLDNGGAGLHEPVFDRSSESEAGDSYLMGRYAGGIVDQKLLNSANLQMIDDEKDIHEGLMKKELKRLAMSSQEANCLCKVGDVCVGAERAC